MTEVFGTPEAAAHDEIEPRHAAPVVNDLAVDPEDTSIFDELEAEANRDLDKFVYYENTLRPGWFMKFRAVIDAHELKRYENYTLGTGKKRNPENADLIKGNAVMLGDKCVAILKGGIEDSNIVADPVDGDDMTFRTTGFVNVFSEKNQAKTVQGAMQKFLGDAQLMKLAGSLLVEAGYDEDAQPVDPTNA